MLPPYASPYMPYLLQFQLTFNSCLNMFATEPFGFTSKAGQVCSPQTTTASAKPCLPVGDGPQPPPHPPPKKQKTTSNNLCLLCLALWRNAPRHPFSLVNCYGECLHCLQISTPSHPSQNPGASGRHASCLGMARTVYIHRT